MPIKYTIYPEKSLVVERFMGRITAAEAQAAMKAIWADPAYEPSFDGIVDLTDATFAMSRSDMVNISELLLQSPRAGAGRLAIIASKPIETAFSFLFQSNTSLKRNVAVFSTWASVREFLNLPESLVVQVTSARK